MVSVVLTSSSTVLESMMSAMMGCTVSDVHVSYVQGIDQQFLWHPSIQYLFMSVQLDVLIVSPGLIPNRQRKECEANSCLHKSLKLE